MKAAHQGVPVAGLPLGDWHSPDAPPAPEAPQPAPVGTPLVIGRGGAARHPSRNSNGLTPPTDVPSADGRLPGAPPPRDAGLLGKLFGSM